MACSRSKNADILCNFLFVAAAMLYTMSVKAMVVEYHSLRPY